MVDDAANRQRQLQPALNSITIPAAILQPPFFNVKAEDAVNYGLLGITFGHEISHAFDDSGSQYDAKGRLRNWWTPEDRRAFKDRAAGLVKQYGAYSPCRAITSTAN
jgi:predicted metalloendopeptidase